MTLRTLIYIVLTFIFSYAFGVVSTNANHYKSDVIKNEKIYNLLQKKEYIIDELRHQLSGYNEPAGIDKIVPQDIWSPPCKLK